MYRGYYLAANGMINQQRALNTISNNMINSQTAGYKRDLWLPTTFDRELLLIRGAKNRTGTIEYIRSEGIQTSLQQGSFQYTENTLDVALQGDVFFNIEPGDNPKYWDYDEAERPYLTRNGQFNIDDEGYLALGSAGRVLGVDGPIQVGSSDFTIDRNGFITTATGEEYQLLLTHVDSTPTRANDVLKKGDNMFTPVRTAEDAEASWTTPADDEEVNFSVIQGAFERSNVDVSEEMTRAIEAQRAFESCSKALQMMDLMNQKTANELGRI